MEEFTLQAAKSDTLAATMAAGATSGTLTTGNFTADANAMLVIDYDVPAKFEIIKCTISGTALTSISRAQDGTTAVEHASGAKVIMAFVPSHYEALKNGTGLVNPVLEAPKMRNHNGWQEANETWAYASATTITVPSGAASKYAVGDKIKLTQTTVKYFYITGVADTVLTVTGGSDYTVADAAISANYYSHESSPIGFPQWFSWAPTYTAGGSMTYGTVTTTYAKFHIEGRTLYFEIRCSGTTGGSADPGVRATYPVTPAESYGICGTATVTNSSVSGRIEFGTSDAVLYFFKYDSSNWPVSSGQAIYGNGFYKI